MYTAHETFDGQSNLSLFDNQYYFERLLGKFELKF